MFICYNCKIKHDHQCEVIYKNGSRIIICNCYCNGQFTKLNELDIKFNQNYNNNRGFLTNVTS